MHTVNRILLLLLVSPLFFSCSRTFYPSASDKLVIYPSPPDTARIQFLTKFSSSREVVGNQKSFAKFLFGEEADILINKPYGITSAEGKMFVCDTYIHGVHIIDYAKNKFEQFTPTGKGELKIPINCAVDDNGNLYVADSERKQIVVFDKDKKFRNSFGEAENFKPTDVFIKGDKIWVVNLANHQINVYSNDLKNELLDKFPKEGVPEAAKLFSPTNIYVTGNRIYVTDFGDFKVKIYNESGEFIESVGSYGQGVGQFARPKGIAVDQDLNLFAVDAGFENVQIFNKSGKLLLFFGGVYKGPGGMWLPAKVALDYKNLNYFEKYVDQDYKLKYLIYVTNQFGPDKINIYGAVEPKSAGEKKLKKK